jgi:hypothetical protein
VALVVLLAACGGPKPEIPDAKTDNKPDTSDIEINGDASDPVNKLAIEAIADRERHHLQPPGHQHLSHLAG